MDPRPVTTPAFRLPEWAQRRERTRRVLGHCWLALCALTVAVGLLDERLLAAPAVAGLATAATLAGGAVHTRLWRWRRRLTGHPVARGALPRTLARGRPQPAGWVETLVTGSVHLTSAGWQWRPSLLCTQDVAVRDWPHPDVVRLRFVPSWGPGLPACCYLRLDLRDGTAVVLLVWDPPLLGLLTGQPDAADVLTCALPWPFARPSTRPWPFARP